MSPFISEWKVLREAVLATEWFMNQDDTEGFCTICGSSWPGPHKDDCIVGAALAAPVATRKTLRSVMPEGWTRPPRDEPHFLDKMAMPPAAPALDLERRCDFDCDACRDWLSSWAATCAAESAGEERK